MIKYLQTYALSFLLIFCIACKGQNKPVSLEENTQSKDRATSLKSLDPNIHTRYEYTDRAGKRLIIQNGNPRGGTKYTAPNGEEYAFAIFWTRIINETDQPLELMIDFLETYEVPSLPGKFFKLMVLPDTMTTDNIAGFNYGLTGIEKFLDTSIHRSSSLRRTINPGASSAFFVLKLNLREEGAGGGDILRTGLLLEGQDLFYRVSRYNSTPDRQPPSIIAEKEIKCGSISLKNLRMVK